MELDETDEEIRSWGLDRLVPGLPHRVAPPPPPAVERGLSAGSAGWGAPDAPPAYLPAPDLDALGALLLLERASPARATLVSTGGPLDLRPGGPGATLAPDRLAVHFDRATLRRAHAVFFAGPTGGVLVVDRDDAESFALRAYFRATPDATARTDAAPPPLDDWLRMTRDSDLADQVRARAATRDPFEVAAALGMLVRRETPPPEALRSPDWLADAPANGVLPFVDPRPIWAWARARPRGATEEVEGRALAVVAGLRGRLTRLAAARPADVAARDEEFRSIARSRDDLEGVLWLLEHAGAGRSLAAALGDLDRSGSAWLASLPREAWPEPDALLSGVRALAPDGWWTLPLPLDDGDPASPKNVETDDAPSA